MTICIQSVHLHTLMNQWSSFDPCITNRSLQLCWDEISRYFDHRIFRWYQKSEYVGRLDGLFRKSSKIESTLK